MRIFVAGATGVLGRATIPRLIAAGYDVTGMARSHSKAESLRAQSAVPAHVDLFDVAALRRVLDGHDAVVHMATSIPPLSRAWRASAWATNDRLRREGTRILIDAACDAGVSVFVKETVSFFYPDCGDSWVDESVTVQSDSFSAASLDAEEIVAAADMRAVVLRFGLFYSADARSTDENLRVAKMGFGPVIGAADAYQPSIHVDDAADAVVSALNAPGGTYNVADNPLTKRDWNDAFADAFDLGRRLRPTPRLVMRLGGQKLAVLGASRRVSSDAFRRITGWTPRYPDATVGLPEVAGLWKGSKP